MTMGAPESDAAIAQLLLRQLRSGDDAQRHEALRRMDADPTLRQRIERLIAATVAPELPIAGPPSRRRIGPYVLIDELGSGGMGAVFLAERDVDGARQRVALKLLHGVPSAEGRRRFTRERALLAGLNHPHIAALLDGGQTDDGQPYLVMEFVEGLAITEWVRACRPDLHRRLRTLIRVCRAVEHAHQRLVLHRDIKPGNVLVRDDGDPMLLDFGIGRALDEHLGSAETATLAFTPAYAAPEQLTGRGLTTATDVYGLGAVMYEVLTGVYLPEFHGTSEVLPVVSAAATDELLRPQLRGDLDRIVTKAMHAEPQRRYSTAAALADDLERFLHGQPVQATPDSLWYRSEKFLRRNRAASLVAVVALIVLSASVWRLAVERERALAAERQAQREAHSARLSRDFLVSVFASAAPSVTLGQPISPRELLDKARDRVERELGADRDAAVSTWRILAATYAKLGAPAASLSAAQQALRYTRTDSVEGRQQRAEVLEALVSAYDNLGRFSESAPIRDELLELREALAADDPVGLAKTYAEFGLGAQIAGDPKRSAPWLLRALNLLDGARAGNDDYFDDRCYVLAGLANAAVAEGDESAARRWIGQAESAAAQLDDDHPTQLRLLAAKVKLAELEGRFEDSLHYLEHASELAVRVVGADAMVVANIENDLGVALNGLSRFREALEHLLRSRAKLIDTLQASPGAVAHLDVNIGAVYESLGDYPRAADYARRALAVYLAEETPDASMRRLAHANLARALSYLGDHAQALAEIGIALDEGRSSEGAQSLTHQLDRFRYVGILRRAGELDRAAAELEPCAAALLDQLGAEHPVKLHVLRMRALIARDRGDSVRAIAGFEAALQFAAQSADVDQVAAAEARVELAELIVDTDLPRARSLVAEALAVLRTALLPVAPNLIEAEQLQQRLQTRA